MEKHTLHIKGLTCRFGTKTAVSNVTLDIPHGQFVAVIGRSGAGKSTLLRMINRLAQPSSGEMTFAGRDITTLKGRDLRLWRRDCAMIFQQFNLVDRLDVLTNVLMGRLADKGFFSSMAKSFTDDERALAVAALERLGLIEQALQPAGTLSGGQQQRVAIAKALVQRPKIMLADEPIASLDPANASQVMNELRRINRDDGLTVLVNLHTLDTAKAYADRIIAMRDGVVVFDGPPARLSRAIVSEIYGFKAGDSVNHLITSTQVGVAETEPTFA